MKILIAYATKSGAGKEAAEMLSSRIENCTLFDLDGGTPDVSSYDMVIAGSGVRMGKAYKPFRKFLSDNENILLTKKLALYLCCMEIDKHQKYLDGNVPDALVKASICNGAFGGKPPFGKKKDGNWMLMDAFDAFADAVKQKTA